MSMIRKFRSSWMARKLPVIRREHVGEDLEIERVGSEPQEPDARRVGVHARMGGVRAMNAGALVSR
jgi:hypothetical protein